MNRKQLIVLFVGLAGMAEWYFGTKNVDYALWVRVAVGAAVLAVVGVIVYMLRDRNESENEE